MPLDDLEDHHAGEAGTRLVSVDGRTYPLVSARLVARAEGGLAWTTLVQEFRNPWDETLEVVYALPLPADGAVVGYRMRIGARVIEGTIAPREDAAEAYAEALAGGRAAGLLEQERDDTFQQRMGAIPPRQDVRVEIEVLHPLAFVPASAPEPARWEYRFPTVVGVRYAGEPGRVADAAPLDVDRAAGNEIPARLDLELTLGDGGPETMDARSLTHDVRCERDGERTRVALREGARLDRDLVVRWNAGERRIGVRLVEGPGRPGDDGRYALLTLTPPLEASAALGRDLTVLVDASGSMHGPSFALARRLVTVLLESLGADDRFEVLTFGSRTHRLTRGLEDARHVRRALRDLERTSPEGGTEMADGVIEALRPLRAEAQRQVVLVTDGMIAFESEVLRTIRRRLPVNARVHVAGVGAAPNRSLTRAVARAGRGIEVFAHDALGADEAARLMCRATVRPVLTEITVSGDAVLGMAPEQPGDVFAGRPLLVALELDPRGGAIEVRGRAAGNDDTWIWRVAVPPVAGRAGAPASADTPLTATTLPLGALYGRELVADLELRRAATDEGDWAAGIEAVALRHRVTSSQTSLVAVAEEPTVDPEAPRRRERLAVEVPAGFPIHGAAPLTGATLLGRSVVLRAFSKDATTGTTGSWEVPAFLRMQMDEESLLLASAPRPEAIEVPIRARVVGVGQDRIEIELAAPYEGFVIPEGEIHVWLDGNEWRIGRVESTGVTTRGPHATGAPVRFVVVMSFDPAWRSARSIDLRWLVPATRDMADAKPRQIVATVLLPEEASRTR